MTPPDPALVQAVSNSPLGRTLSAPQIAALAGLTKLLIHRPHDILAEGVVDPQLFCVVDGSLDVVKHLGTPDETVPRDAVRRRSGARAGLSRRHAALCVAGRDEPDAACYGLDRSAPRRPDRQRAADPLRGDVRDRPQRPPGPGPAADCRPPELTNYVVKQHGRY